MAGSSIFGLTKPALFIKYKLTCCSVMNVGNLVATCVSRATKKEPHVEGAGGEIPSTLSQYFSDRMRSSGCRQHCRNQASCRPKSGGSGKKGVPGLCQLYEFSGSAGERKPCLPGCAGKFASRHAPVIGSASPPNCQNFLGGFGDSASPRTGSRWHIRQAQVESPTERISSESARQ